MQAPPHCSKCLRGKWATWQPFPYCGEPGKLFSSPASNSQCQQPHEKRRPRRSTPFHELIDTGRLCRPAELPTTSIPLGPTSAGSPHHSCTCCLLVYPVHAKSYWLIYSICGLNLWVSWRTDKCTQAVPSWCQSNAQLLLNSPLLVLAPQQLLFPYFLLLF